MHGPGPRSGGGEARVVVALVGMWEAAELLAVVRSAAVRCDKPVGDDVVDIGSGSAAGVSQVGCLQGRGPIGKNADATAAGVKLQIQQDVQLVLRDARGRLLVAERMDLDV